MNTFNKNILLLVVVLFSMAVSANTNSDELATLYKFTLNCKSFVRKIENHFLPMRGLKKVDCNIENQTVQITYSAKRWDSEKIVAQFKKLELDVKPMEVAASDAADK